jgi:hypothetical protein
VPSFTWDDATAADGNPVVDAGAVTWCDQVRGCRGAISAENSLVGTRTYDFLGSDGVMALPNGSYLVVSTLWDNESVTNAGAVTWCPAPGGCTGVVMSDNSLIGSKIYDQMGSSGIVLLPSGEYVIVSDSWDSALAHDAGVVTVGSQESPAFGSVSSENSIWGVSAFGGGVLAVQYNAFRDYLVVARPKDNAVSLFK